MAFDFPFEHPDQRVAFGQGTEALANGVGAGPAFSEPVGFAVAERFGDRFESQRVERLHGAVPHDGNAQGTFLAVLLNRLNGQWKPEPSRACGFEVLGELSCLGSLPEVRVSRPEVSGP